MTLKNFLTIAQLADQTGVPVGTWRNYRQRNIGPESFIINGRVMYRPEAVDAWFAAQMAQSARGGR